MPIWRTKTTTISPTGLTDQGSGTAATGANGGVLEGLINLVDEFGELPTEVYVAVGAFQTADGGNLIASLQVPSSNDGDLNLDGDEWLRIEPHTLRSGDFNEDDSFGCADVDALVAAIVAGTDNRVFDLTGDGLVDADDLAEWLAKAGAAELASGNAFLMADANLDGYVDGRDLLIWNANRFQSNSGWCGADFNADGTVDGHDFALWNANKFTSAHDGQTIPEPAAISWLLIAIARCFRRGNAGC